MSFLFNLNFFFHCTSLPLAYNSIPSNISVGLFDKPFSDSQNAKRVGSVEVDTVVRNEKQSIFDRDVVT